MTTIEEVYQKALSDPHFCDVKKFDEPGQGLHYTQFPELIKQNRRLCGRSLKETPLLSWTQNRSALDDDSNLAVPLVDDGVVFAYEDMTRACAEGWEYQMLDVVYLRYVTAIQHTENTRSGLVAVPTVMFLSHESKYHFLNMTGQALWKHNYPNKPCVP
jgi:hypothetical protein